MRSPTHPPEAIAHRIARKHSKSVNSEPTPEPASENEIWKRQDMGEYLNTQPVVPI
ncbi:hypothetical protein NIES4074_37110 [Cylindrospermum sp. NIES-4074]|nr:hypothetical protein NIES4074_37110 [Cylindrospermum sp. NIES-4074]